MSGSKCKSVCIPFFTWLQTIYAKIMQTVGNSKTEKLRFAVLDTAGAKLILCKDNASERKESLLLVSRVPLILCKDKAIFDNAKKLSGKAARKYRNRYVN